MDEERVCFAIMDCAHPARFLVLELLERRVIGHAEEHQPE